MLRRRVVLLSTKRSSIPASASTRSRLPLIFIRGQHTSPESKYAEKLRIRAEESGLSVQELKEKAKAALKEQQRQQRAELEAVAARLQEIKDPSERTSATSATPIPEAVKSVRKDSSPVKPLSSILNLPRVLSTTPEQVSALWTAYHASRSEGTGRGYLCAAIPVDLYNQMSSVASKYPSFITPVPRIVATDTDKAESGEENASEFYFLEWAFHESPPVPSAKDADPFATPSTAAQSPNPPTSTVLFTPLQEYKLRASFATPYLVLTHYTDLAQTHGIVLLRGEITPSPSGAEGRYLLTQEDAQLLSMGIQKFYLWSGKGGNEETERKELLKIFHENPAEFKWEELLKHAGTVV